MSEESSTPTEVSTPVVENQAVDNSAAPTSASNGASEQIDAIADAVENGDLTPQEAKKMIEKFELKVRGKTITREVDLSDKEYIKQQLQLAEVSRMSMQEKAEQEKNFERLLQNAKADPAAFLAQLGLDPDEFSAMHIEKKIAHLKKSPQEIEIEEMRAELAAAREKEKQAKEEIERAEMTKLQQEVLSGLEEEISSAIAHTKLPNTQYVKAKMAKAMHWAEENGFPGATAADVADLVAQEMRKELNEMFDQMPEDTLELYAGRKNIDRLRKSKIAKAKDIASVNAIKPTSAGAQTSAPAKEEVKIDSKKFWRGR